MQIMQGIALISRKIYTAGTNFTRPPVVTVATNLNSGDDDGDDDGDGGDDDIHYHEDDLCEDDDDDEDGYSQGSSGTAESKSPV